MALPNWKLDTRMELIVNDNYWGIIGDGGGAQFAQGLPQQGLVGFSVQTPTTPPTTPGGKSAAGQ